MDHHLRPAEVTRLPDAKLHEPRDPMLHDDPRAIPLAEAWRSSSSAQPLELGRLARHLNEPSGHGAHTLTIIVAAMAAPSHHTRGIR
jgi:hypothetical protein